MTWRRLPSYLLRLFPLLLLRWPPFWERSWKHRTARLGLYAVYVYLISSLVASGWRLPARLGLYAVYVYLGILAVLLALEDRMLYVAGAAAEWVEAPEGVLVRDVELTSADGTRLHAWWAVPEGWRPGQGAVLFCHGNGGNLSHRGWALRPWLTEMKQAVLIFDYPGFGRSLGRPSEAGCYAAGDAAYDYLVGAQKVPARRILLHGGSLGGGIATDLAMRHPHRALVLTSTFTSFPDMAQKVCPWLPGRYLVHNRFDNLAKIAACRGPVFIAHDTADGLIPFAQGQRLFEAAGAPKRLFVMSHHGHLDCPSPDVFPALRQFLEEVEGRAPAD